MTKSNLKIVCLIVLSGAAAITVGWFVAWSLGVSRVEVLRWSILTASLAINIYALLELDEWGSTASIAAALTTFVTVCALGLRWQTALGGYSVVLAEGFFLSLIVAAAASQRLLSQITIVVSCVALFAQVLWRGGTWLEAAEISLVGSIVVSAAGGLWGIGGALASTILTVTAVSLVGEQLTWLPPLAKAFGFSALVWVILLVVGIISLFGILAVQGKERGEGIVGQVGASAFFAALAITIVSLVGGLIAATGETNWPQAGVIVLAIPAAILGLELAVGTGIKDAGLRALLVSVPLTAVFLVSSLLVLAGATWLEAIAAVSVLGCFLAGAGNWRAATAVVVLVLIIGAAAGATWLHSSLAAVIVIFAERRRSQTGGTFSSLLGTVVPETKTAPPYA